MVCRAFNGEPEEGANRFANISRTEQRLDGLLSEVIPVSPQASHKQGGLVTKDRVKAWPSDAHLLHQIIDGCAIEAFGPENLRGHMDRVRLVETARSAPSSTYICNHSVRYPLT